MMYFEARKLSASGGVEPDNISHLKQCCMISKAKEAHAYKKFKTLTCVSYNYYLNCFE